MNTFQLADYFVFISYFVLVIGVALYISRKPKDHERNAEDYFLAGRSLPWWIIGASLIASNISTEQIIGMNGTAFESGIAVVSYSLIGACLTLLLVAKYFLPAFLKMKIYSMPEFLEKRYSQKVSVGMSVFWILVYIFVNLTSVLSLGAITLDAVLDIPVWYSVIGLACISAVFTVYGGLSAVAWTDFIQVSILIVGGLAVVWIGLDAVGGGEGPLQGFSALYNNQSDKFHTVLAASHHELPWTGVFMGGLWIAALSYWGCNQYIIQRALAAKSTTEARNGLIFAAFLSLIVAVIIVLPGVIASDLFADRITSRDQAFPFLVKELLPVGVTGLVIASLIAAIISSLNSMCNSVATIFTMDIYRKIKPDQLTNDQMITVGRIVTAACLIIAVVIAPSLTKMGRLFSFIQEYTGFVSPGVLCVFLMGLLWKRATSSGAMAALLLTIPLSVYFKFFMPEMAFLNRMMITFVGLVVIMGVVSLMTDKRPDEYVLDRSVFRSHTSLGFYILSSALVGIIAAIYIIFW